VVWAHGFETLGWYRRLFRVHTVRQVASFALSSTRRQLTYRRLVRYCRRTGRGAFVVPSRWMLSAMQIDTLSQVPRAHVIPNPVDGNLFPYVEKTPDMRTRVMLLRSFESRKYATDIATDAIARLSGHQAFRAFEFNLIGQGRLFQRAAARLQRFPNVHLHERFSPQSEIPALHAQHGVMLCPTRQDSQGVSMCEAMSSGLVPLASDNTAIPEFVTDGVSGLLSKSSRQIAEQLLRLHADPELFGRLSRGAGEEARRKCGLPAVAQRELEVLESAVFRSV
jgi:glycosyltransferase involved in cell wall biosynthesis